MDSMAAYSMGQQYKGREAMVFDWEKAARIIKERNAKNASAGLASDWEWTGGPIYQHGIIPGEETHTYLASTWATPELEVDGKVMVCYKMQSDVPGWDAETYWPEEAIAILEGQTDKQP